MKNHHFRLAAIGIVYLLACRNLFSLSGTILEDLDIFIATTDAPIGREKPASSTNPSTSFSTRDEPMPRRIFLGIFTASQFDDNRRIIIRNTYLKEGDPQHKINVCSISKIKPDCQIVYAFIRQAKKGRNEKYETDSSDDVIYLVKEGSNKVLSLYQFLAKSELLRTKKSGLPYNSSLDATKTEGRTGTPKVQFDFVAHTTTAFVLKPDHLWPQEVFKGNNSVFAHPRLLLSATVTSGKQNVSGYTLLSSDLVEPIIDHDVLGSLEPQELATIVSEAGPVVVLQDLDQPERSIADDSVLVAVLRDGITQPAKGNRKSNHVRLLDTWDTYKDLCLVTYNDTKEELWIRSNKRSELTNCRHGPRLLLGIMSVLDHDSEQVRRQTIRETYLSFFSQSETERHRICALAELLDKSRADHSILVRDCQLAYTFVVGGNPEGSTERLTFTDPEPLTLAPAVSEPDVVVLNIKENMNDGKSQTYFKYGTTVVDNQLYFDYIIKCDTDTLIFPEYFLNYEMKRLPVFPNNVRVYGGFDLLSREDAMYYAGSLYFLSVDMARYISSDACDRKTLDVFSEDRALGLFAHSHPLPLKRVNIGLPSSEEHKMGTKALWSRTAAKHPVKNVTAYRTEWNEYMRSMRKHRRK